MGFLDHMATLDFPGSSVVKDLLTINLPENTGAAGGLGFGPWVRKIPWRRRPDPTLIFLPGEFHGQRTLVGYRPWGCKESDRTK